MISSPVSQLMLKPLNAGGITRAERDTTTFGWYVNRYIYSYHSSQSSAYVEFLKGNFLLPIPNLFRDNHKIIRMMS